MMAKEMSPRQFHEFWISDEGKGIRDGIRAGYDVAKSPEEKAKVLEYYGFSEYQPEIERELWLEDLIFRLADVLRRKDGPLDRLIMKIFKKPEWTRKVRKFRSLRRGLELDAYEAKEIRGICETMLLMPFG